MTTDNSTEDYFVERIENVSFANGVFRISFGTQEEDQQTHPSVRLLIPANQISAILQGMANAAKDIDEKVKAKISEIAAKPGTGEKKNLPTKAKAK